VCIRLRRIRAKTQLSRLVNGRYQGGVELWVTTAAGPSPAATHTGPASRRPAGRSVRRCRSPANMPGAFTARSVRHRTATPAVSAMGGAAIALQLMPGDLQAPDRGGHPPTLAKNNRGPVERPKVGTAGPARGFLPLAAARALMCGAEDRPVLRHGAGHASAIDDGFWIRSRSRRRARRARAAGHRNQDHLGARTSPCLRH
jgi:hypothetical protein